MAHYIDAEKLIAEIERHIKEVKEAENRSHPNLGFFDAKLSGIYDTLSIIDSLQQEQPKAPVDGEVHHVLNCHYLATDNEQLCARLREFPEGAKVNIFIIAKEDK